MFKSKSIRERNKRRELCFCFVFLPTEFSISELLHMYVYLYMHAIHFTIVFKWLSRVHFSIISIFFYFLLYFVILPNLSFYAFRISFFFLFFFIISTRADLINELTCNLPIFFATYIGNPAHVLNAILTFKLTLLITLVSAYISLLL